MAVECSPVHMVLVTRARLFTLALVMVYMGNQDSLGICKTRYFQNFPTSHKYVRSCRGKHLKLTARCSGLETRYFQHHSQPLVFEKWHCYQETALSSQVLCCILPSRGQEQTVLCSQVLARQNSLDNGFLFLVS